MDANSLQGNLTGSRTEGNLQVFMDVGLAGAVGMSADELKQRMDSVIALIREVGELKTKINNLEVKLVRQADENERTVQFQKHEIEDLKEKLLNQARENDEMDEPDEEEPGIALEDQLRIAEQSAKAIELLSSQLLFTVWQTCSKNTYGNDVCFIAHFRDFECAPTWWQAFTSE